MALPKKFEFAESEVPAKTPSSHIPTIFRYALETLITACAFGLIALVAGFGLIAGSFLAETWLPNHSLQQPESHGFLRMLTCYYAHPMALYGTPRETEDVHLLESLGFHVINPNVPEYKNKEMSYFCDLAANADLVAFRSLPDGKISPGVGLELKKAKKIVELPSGTDERTISQRGESR